MITSRTVLTVLAVLVALFSVPLAPATAQEQAWRNRVSYSDDVTASDISEEVRFGREVAARIIARYGLYDNPQIMKYVNLVGSAVAEQAGRPELQFHFGVLDTNEINGYAAPGGYVFITKGALARMQDESELAGALAHEIGHVVERHVVKELNIRSSDTSGASGLAVVIGAGTEAARLAFSQFVDKAVDILFKEGYKRDDEAQADRDAVMFTALTGYDPAGLSRFFERLSRVKGPLTEILDRTHPAYDVRIAAMQALMSEEGMAAGTYMTNKERFSGILKQYGNFIALDK